MSRPFRHRPPEVAADSVLRPRVQEALAGRFDRRVTCLVAGAGFGKTTALAQAFEENRLAPLGVDGWLACAPEDADPVRFAHGLSASFELDEAVGPDELVDAAVEAVGSRAPSVFCLVLDDVQFLADTVATGLLQELIDRLPTTGHVVVSGRRLPALTLTRLELIGEAVVVDEEALAFDAAEIRRLLGAEPDVDVGDVGGWPALVRLAESGRSRRFVDEEVLASLESDELELIRALAILGESDVATLEQLVGGEATSVLESLPLVHRRQDRWAAHDLWSDLLAPLDPVLIERTRRDASRLLVASGDSVGAVEVLAPLPAEVLTTADEQLNTALREVMTRPDRLDPAILRRWASRWRQHGPEESDAVQPSVLLLHGLLHRLDNPGGEQCQELLRAAAEAFRADGDDIAAVSALGALVYSYHVRRDVDRLLWAFGELQHFADVGVAEAQPFPLLGRALVATSSASPADVIAATERLLEMPLRDDMRAITLWLHANALGNLGQRAVEPAAECYEIGLQLPGMAMIHSGARWRAGMIRDMLESPTEPLDGERDRFLAAAWETCLAAALGDIAAAESHFEVVQTSSTKLSQWQTAGSVLLPEMTVHGAAGRRDEAMRAARDFLAATPADDQGRFYRWFGIGAIYPYVPEERAWYDEQIECSPAGPLYRRDYELVRAIVAIEEDRDVDVVRSLAFPTSAEEMMPSVGLHNGATLLAAAVGIGRDDVSGQLADLVDLVGERARDRWHELRDHPAPFVADGARQIIESLPVPPADPVELGVLGTTVLRVGSHEVDHPDWRRERVRALLTYLVLHPDVTREQAMAALWPDAEQNAARRSLRTTLNTLHDVLEPQRRGGDAPFFVRSSGQRLSLHVSPVSSRAHGASAADGLFVDVVQLERLIDAGESFERRGTPSRSVEPYLAAVELYRGDLLPDCYDDWAVFDRDRLRGRLVRAAVRAAELLGATGRGARAADVATRALTIEPWSEPAHRALIAAHLEIGDVAAARRSLETCERVLADLGGPSEDETLELSRRLARR